MSFESEYEEKMRGKKKSKIAPFLPAIGLIIIGVLGFISYILSGPVHDFLMNQFATVPPDQEVTLLIAGGIFLVLLMVVAIIYAIFAPKPQKGISERELDKEKKEKLREMEAAKKRKRKIRAQRFQENKKR